MRVQLKRVNYVTPTNYLELVRGYVDVLREKRRSFESMAQKLRDGLFKLEQSRVQVEEVRPASAAALGARSPAGAGSSRRSWARSRRWWRRSSATASSC